MNPILYLIMRNDIPSMNPGKLAAQAAHCANAFEYEFNKSGQAKKHLGKLYKAWKNQTKQGFGTTITLGADEGQLLWQGRHLSPPNNCFANHVYDPTYPCEISLEIGKYLAGYSSTLSLPFKVNINLNSNSAILLRKELVGMYVFGDKDNEDVKWAVDNLELYP